MFDSPGLVDFAVGLVGFILHLSDEHVKVLGEFFFLNSLYLEEFLGASENNFWASASWLQLAWKAIKL